MDYAGHSYSAGEPPARGMTALAIVEHPEVLEELPPGFRPGDGVRVGSLRGPERRPRPRGGAVPAAPRPRPGKRWRRPPAWARPGRGSAITRTTPPTGGGTRRLP